MTARIEPARLEYFRALRLGRLLKFVITLLLLSFAVWTVVHLDIPVERMLGMFPRIGNILFGRMMPPDVVYALQPNILYRVLETIEMTFLGAFFGTVISIFVAWFGA